MVVALIWKWILQREGVLNAFLDWTGAGGINWLVDAQWAFAWSVFISVWAHMGFYTLILLAGLQAIPRDVYEAATMDRASPWRTFRKITLPLLSPTMLVVLVLALIKGVQTFDEVYAFTGGGPGTATTFIISTSTRKASPGRRASSVWRRRRRCWWHRAGAADAGAALGQPEERRWVRTSLQRSQWAPVAGPRFERAEPWVEQPNRRAATATAPVGPSAPRP